MHTLSFGPTHVVERREAAPLIAITPSAAEMPAESQSTGTESVDTEPNERSPVIHRNILCDSCNEIIIGVRRKCLDCPGEIIRSNATQSPYILYLRLRSMRSLYGVRCCREAQLVP
jgi:hypothetical protein